MVLINNLTIDEINAALIHLQRSKTEVVGGEKGNTIQNITINNSGSGASVPDFTVTIQLIQERLAELGATDDEIKAQIETLKQTIQTLTSNNVAGVRFEEETRRLFIILEDGDSYYTEITSEEINLVYDSDTDKLVLTMGLQRKEVTLPYIKEIEKGVAGGVASLDNTGRVPYSQLPESAMEFKGEWDASTNTPHLEDGTGVNGDFYIVSTGGTVNFGTVEEPREITFYPNDRVIYEGDTDLWVRLPAGSVVSVNGMSGAVVLDATNIMYDANQTIKQKIDSTAQADWTQTNSSDPSFIKHKIPIWITSGSADDNMTPIDSVTSGEMRPVTSNAVYGAINTTPTMQTIINDSDAEVHMQRFGKLVIFYIHAKRGTGGKYVSISPYTITNVEGAKTPLTWDDTIKGEAYMNTNTEIAMRSSTESSGQIITFLA